MNMVLMILGFVSLWFGGRAVYLTLGPSREMDRFREGPKGFINESYLHFNSLLASIAARKSQKQTLGYQARKSKNDLTRKMLEAGLESAAEQGKFFLFRAACFVSGPAIGVLTYVYLPAYYATISTLILSGIALLAPAFWLKMRTQARTEDVQRELPLVLDLTNLGTSAGWDVAAAFERVIDSLFVEFPRHPLIKELKRARWLTLSGCTWEEALLKLGTKLGDDTVKRTTLALSQAIKQGGDRTRQLESIAGDAQRVYYAQLDKRLAALPVKALLVTMMLMVAYFIILLAPAAVQVKTIMMQ